MFRSTLHHLCTTLHHYIINGLVLPYNSPSTSTSQKLLFLA
uniref:Uncharacterized protein n=1 Tax=Acinetobacter phage vB_Ab_1137_KEN_03 TaxID=3158853 RepID=A0AAU8KZ13_9CAUD